ncbi:MAG: heme exporter protein CcmD [Asticcacaulis sp.]|uniref:heme exporter protein CcmD n=1 Tax=Asticcacaulis sp. TaxID=1872648 RepID=UPI0039E3E271
MDVDMGKYGLYVWGAYGATVVALIGLIVMSLRAQAKRRKVLEALQAAVDGK